MSEEILVESCRHHHHARTRTTAVPLAWTAAVVVEQSDRLNVDHRHEWRSGAGPIGHEARHPECGASQEGNPGSHGVISGAAQSASRLLANPDTQPDAHAHGGCNPNPNAGTDAGSNADTRPHRRLHV